MRFKPKYKSITTENYLDASDKPLELKIPDIYSKRMLLSWISNEADGPIYYPRSSIFSSRRRFTGFWRFVDEGSPYAISKDYQSYYIPKRTKGLRRIDAPSEHLKCIQRWILDYILYKFPCSKYAKAYIKKISIRDNARYHQNRKLVITLDIKDFFNSIKAFHVYNWFKKCGYPENVTVLLTNLCVFNGSLPQGAPTSGYLSNLIMCIFDSEIAAYCREKAIRYTRYADDMTFSANTNIDIAQLIHVVETHLKTLGLELNKSKIKVLRQNTRQKTTGLVLNEKMQVPKEYRMRLRQEIYFIKKYGLDSHLATIGETDKIKYLNNLAGRIQYVLSIRKDDKSMQRYSEYVKALLITLTMPVN